MGCGGGSFGSTGRAFFADIAHADLYPILLVFIGANPIKSFFGPAGGFWLQPADRRSLLCGKFALCDIEGAGVAHIEFIEGNSYAQA